MPVHKADYGTRHPGNGQDRLCVKRAAGAFCLRKGNNMPKTRLQRSVFALLTVLGTVHAYVFYSLYVVKARR